MFPKSLSRPDDRLKSAEQWELLSERLFDDLLTARHALEPPGPSELWQEWSKWDDFTPDSGPNLVGKDTLCDWLRAYEASLAELSDASSYVRGVVSLLLRDTEAERVPIVVAQDGRPARVLLLEVTRVEIGSGQQWLHPAFEHRRMDVNARSGTFAEGMSRTWEAARITDCKPASSDIFWRLRSADGGPLPLMKLDGPSASAAAYRAFWHIAQGLHIDSDVYVLADATASDGHIEAVGHLREKISAINAARSSLSPYPPTLIAAKDVSADDLAALNTAREWAEVKTVATTVELTAVRSCTASAVIAYMEHLAEKLDETPWTRHGKPVRLSEVHVPPQVWKDEYSFHPAAESEPGGGQRDWRPAGYDPASADREVAPRLRQQRRKVRVPWIREFQRPQHQPIVIVGGPGFGKTSLLRWTAREIVLESLATLHARSKPWSEIRWPIITDLAAWLSKDGDSHDALRDAALDFAPLPKTHPKLQREALPQVLETRLITQTEHTHLFLDALDQVLATQLRLLRKRLDALDFFASRLVFSTREAALTTHLPIMSFPRLTILEAAALSTEDARALAAKWLDAKLATRLEAHLRAQPAMAVVADSPLLLTLACGIVARSPNAELPETAAYLYRDLMQSLARGEWRDEGTDAVHDPDALLARLRPMAWRLFSREPGVNRFSRDTLIRALNGGSSSAGAQTDAALNQLCHLGFLEGSGHSQGEPHYQFRHTTFLEFLAASHLAAEINAESWAQAKVPQWHSENGWQPIKISEILDANAFEPAWEPLFAFTNGLLKQPKALLEMLADRNKDDTYRYRLGLLCMCYGSLAADKEEGVEDLMDRVLPIIERMGRIARRRHPDRWRGWLATVGHLLNLPKAGSRISKVLTLDEDREHRMMGRHELLEILARAAQHSRCSAGMEALLSICEGDVDYYDLDDAATKVVTLAKRLGLAQPIKRLEQAMDIAAEKPWKQIKLARALLRVSDGRVAKKAFKLLSGLAENKSIEVHYRIHAVQALEETLDTPLEAQGSALMVSCLLDPPFGASSPNLWALAGDFMKTARRCSSEPTETMLVFQRLVLRLASDDSFQSLCTKLIRSHDTIARGLGIELLLSAVRTENTDCYMRAQVAEVLLEHGGDSEREEALSVLKSMAKAPIGDGRRRMLALSALLKAGHAYNDEVKQWLREFGVADGVDSCWVEGAAEIAQERNDTALFEVLMPRLRWIMNRLKTPDLSWTDYWTAHRRVAKLFFGTAEWEMLETNALARLRGQTNEDKENWFPVDVVCFGAKSSGLIQLTEELLAVGKWNFHPWVPLMRELARRGWRFRISRRKVVILRRGQEEPRADAEFGY